LKQDELITTQRVNTCYHWTKKSWDVT